MGQESKDQLPLTVLKVPATCSSSLAASEYVMSHEP